MARLSTQTARSFSKPRDFASRKVCRSTACASSHQVRFSIEGSPSLWLNTDLKLGLKLSLSL